MYITESLCCSRDWHNIVNQLCCCCSVAESCPALCDPMHCSTPGFPVFYYHPEFAQIQVHWYIYICIYIYIQVHAIFQIKINNQLPDWNLLFIFKIFSSFFLKLSLCKSAYRTRVSCIPGRSFTILATSKASMNIHTYTQNVSTVKIIF